MTLTETGIAPSVKRVPGGRGSSRACFSNPIRRRESGAFQHAVLPDRSETRSIKFRGSKLSAPPCLPGCIRLFLLPLDRQATTCLLSFVGDVFEALAAPARRAILDVLHERDGQTLFEICSRLTMNHHLTLTRQAISQHLDMLEAVGLVSTRREGRYKFHYLDTTPLKVINTRWLKPARKGVEK